MGYIPFIGFLFFIAFTTFFFLCVYVFICLHVCTWGHVCSCLYPPNVLDNEHRDYEFIELGWVLSPIDLYFSISPFLGSYSHVQDICGDWWSNSDIHSCAMNTSLTELNSQPGFYQTASPPLCSGLVPTALAALWYARLFLQL